jgi:hypothetical protein
MFTTIKNIVLDIEDIFSYVYQTAHYYLFGKPRNKYYIDFPTPVDGVETHRLYARKKEDLMTKKNAATKAWETRRALAAKRSAAAKKAWATRRKMAKKTK